MAYLTPAELRTILNPDGDDTDEGSAAGMSDAQLQVALDDAQAEVDGKLAARTTVPLATPLPRLIRSLVADIAAYLATLTDRRSDPMGADDPVRLRYVRAAKLLDELAAGRHPLPSPLSEADWANQSSAAVNPYDGQMMTPADAGMQHVGGGQYVAGGSRYGTGYGYGWVDPGWY